MPKQSFGATYTSDPKRASSVIFDPIDPSFLEPSASERARKNRVPLRKKLPFKVFYCIKMDLCEKVTGWCKFSEQTELW